MDFCDKHNVSVDRPLCGDLKGLQRMTNRAKAKRSGEASEHTAAVFAAFGKLNASSRKAVVFCLQSQL